MQRLSINMLKNLTDLEEAVEKEYRKKIEKVNVEGCDGAIFVYKKPEESKPEWYSYLAPVKASLPESLTSPSALLVVKAKGSIFAITFGFGRYILNLNKVVSDFGLKVCLNTIPSNKIKTLDKTNLEQMGFHTRQQATIPMDFNTFNIEVERDLLKSVEGHLEDGIAAYLKGSTSLTISTEKDISELTKLCLDLKKIYEKDIYKNEFGWIDNIKLIKDEDKIATLDKLLNAQLENEDFDGCFLGAPEITDDEKIGSYRIVGLYDSASYLLFPTIEQYIAQKNARKNNATSLIDGTKSHRISAYDRNKKVPDTVYTWSVYRCLHAETVDQGTTYKLLDGDWYEIDDQFISDIDKTIAAIPSSKIPFPKMNIGESENSYNIRASGLLKGACLDCDLIRPKGRSPFEFCDIFTPQSHLIHVKKYTGASSMSHLLYQSFVSGQLFSQSPIIRQEVSKKKVVQKASLTGVVNPTKFSTAAYEIVIAVASSKSKPVTNLISFFSKVSLAHKYKTLKSLGYKVSIAKIHIS